MMERIESKPSNKRLSFPFLAALGTKSELLVWNF